MSAITGLGCPRCAAAVSVPEGQPITDCPACGISLLVAGERGVHRYQVARRVDRAQALAVLAQLWSGLSKAPGLRRDAVVRECFPIFLPYWRARAQVTGWRFGTEKRGSGKSTRHVPVEVQIEEEMVWTDAACDASEFGVPRLPIPEEVLQPYDGEALRARAMVFEPVESASEARQQAREHFAAEARRRQVLSETTFEEFQFLREQLALVFLPLWVIRYQHRGRLYQGVVDGARPRLLFGQAPGNIYYRAAMLIGGAALGSMVAVDGPVGAIAVLGDVDLGLLLVPVAAGIFVAAAGYRAFRHGEEIVDRHPDTLKPEETA